MIPVITSFLPPTHTHLYLPSLFKLWEGFNSSVMDDRLLDLAGELSEEHVAGASGDAGEEGGAQWKDIGMWSQEEWTVLVGKGLGSMSMFPIIQHRIVDTNHIIDVPVGATRGSSTTSGHADAMADRQSLRIKKSVSRYRESGPCFVHAGVF